MKYAIGNRINYVQLESQFSNEMEMFLGEYAGNNDSKYHKAISIITQIYMRAGNTGGYFIPVEDDDIIIQSRQFHIGIAELKAIYDVATKRDVFDREKYLKHHIITNNALQIAFISAKAKNTNWSMDGNYILEFVYKKIKYEDKNLKIADKLDKFISKSQSIEPKGIEPNRIELNRIEVCDPDDDMTLDEFKQKFPSKCITLPEDWHKPSGVKLSIISKAIENSQKFLAVKAYMTLEKLASDYYQKVCAGYYDDSSYNVNVVKTQFTKNDSFTEGLNSLAKALEVLPDD